MTVSATTASTVVLSWLSLTALFLIFQWHTDWNPGFGWATLRCSPMMSFLGFLVAAVLVIAAARATMVTWITVLVLLAFAGNRRKVLVKRGRDITTDVAFYLVRVVVKQKGFVALAFATVFSFMALARW